MKRVLTYGTYDLLHYGHIRLLKRARELGDYLIVAISTDEFNEIKHKKAYHNYATRKEMLEAVRYVDLVIPEEKWEQKIDDVKNYKVDIVCMGKDWEGDEHFEPLKDICEVVYLDRTEGVSTTQIKKELNLGNYRKNVNQIPEEKESRGKKETDKKSNRETNKKKDQSEK